MKDLSRHMQLGPSVQQLLAKGGPSIDIPDNMRSDLANVTGVLESPQHSTMSVRRDGYGDLIFIRSQDSQDWMRAGEHVAFNVIFNYKGPLAINLQRRRQAR